MLGSSPTVTRVLRGELCAGCGLCAALAPQAITMATPAPGFNRPVLRGAVPPEVEKVIAHTCPGVVVAPWDQDRSNNIHPYWGPWRQVATGYATDAKVRYEGSSGGALSALAIHALETGLVDRVIHVAADEQHPTRNVMQCSTTAAEILAGAGSRYSPSSPLEQVDKILSDGGKVAFVGKPCDVSALRRLAAVDARVNDHVAVMLSFFCGGMPSHQGATRILDALGVVEDELVSFRYRGRGWPGYAVGTQADGSSVEMTYAESWGGHLSKEVQFRCKICPDAVGGVADIAGADAWYGGESGYPSFDEQDGRSLMVVRTAVGEMLVRSALAAKAIVAEALPIDEIDLMQPAQARRKRLVKARLTALQTTLQPRPIFQGVLVNEAAKRGSVSDAVKNFAGTVRRVLIGKR